MLTRRQLIKTGLAGSLLLAGAGYLATPERDHLPAHATRLGYLSAHDTLLISAIAPAMLAVPGVNLAAVVQGVNQAMMALPLGLQAELRQLLDLLANPWGRRWLAGVSTPWQQASQQQIGDFLRRWQLSRFALLRTGFQALHALIMAAWYGNPLSWGGLAYQRPAMIVELLP